jgi:hypothetical protein
MYKCYLMRYSSIVRSLLAHWFWQQIVPFLRLGYRDHHDHGGCDKSTNSLSFLATAVKSLSLVFVCTCYGGSWQYFFFCSVCGGVIEQAAGTVDLPTINGYYRNNMDCRYVFRQPEGKRVVLTFTKFNLQKKQSDGKCMDYVQVRATGNRVWKCLACKF